MKYFEIAKAEGEGTLTEHYVKASPHFCFPVMVRGAATQVIVEAISVERFDEFVKIHGSEVAVP